MVDIRRTDGQVDSAGGLKHATPAFGGLIYGGGTAFTSASAPSSGEVVDGTGVSAGSAFGTTLSATDGTITILRKGIYEITCNIEDFSTASPSGNIQFDVQKNGAATSPRMQVIRAQSASKFGVILSKRIALVPGDVIRLLVTAAAGGATTITEGSLFVRQLADSITDKTA